MTTARLPLDRVVIRFAGDSGDGMQLVGDRFAAASAILGNDLSTLPDFPAEIRAPAGTVAGVSSFQVHFASHDILTPGDHPDVLVAMNPAALKANIADLRPGGVLIVDVHGFTEDALEWVGYEDNPLSDGSLEAYTVQAVDITGLATAAVAEFGLSRKDSRRVKNMFALGLVSWLYDRPLEPTVAFLGKRFGDKPGIRDANITALRTGWAFGETTEAFAVSYEVAPAALPAGTYRNVHGNLATAYGLVAGAQRAGLDLFLGSYPITPASEILHELSKLKSLGVRTFQAEDEIAAAGAAIGASYAGLLAATVTSGPGMALKSEALGLAVMLELPLVVVNVQRGGPSTGLPTKTEQADLFQAVYGRHGESPLPVLAARSPADCFDTAVEACRIALEYRTPVVLLSDAYIANGSEPWRVPAVEDLPDLSIEFATAPNSVDNNGAGVFLPYARDPVTLARPLALPGTPGLQHRIGGLEKDARTGAISYDPDNHDRMVRTRHDKIDWIPTPPVRVDDPSGPPGEGAKTIVVSWGSTYGPVGEACRRIRRRGMAIAQAHLRYLNPLPADLESVLSNYETVLVPELNLGQLASMIRSNCLIDTVGYNQMRGVPFRAAELERAFVNLMLGTTQC
ncbi:2-oxoacid:acceptor oxidoreductase subunit alpha [Candidatus Mycolicibacterium alkanivorans]|uniref:2-oxoacid:acceptor oxidoreductase subunit alpha n=1 Tax=Candidatus Mycolicibacterium alkanivorans TaxID=2954114 RepID=A0ABS9YRX1_9MYCO|nr:2-oxoacid:acceptor oxidoreductase subunit alpha [Candidatus Mycolicibacterium alkanivorans]MCI4673627.1 2-oxoacid:acceptor oxidoreductase subunit alpha [Candidatus Mycolicibacterium alkanivorans]